MKTIIYLLLAFTTAYLSVVYFGVARIGIAIYLIVIGFALKEYMKQVPRFVPRLWRR